MSDSFTLSRDYAAAPERLFKAWTDLATLTRWFGCGDNMLWTVHEWDVRPGGFIHVSLQFPNGPFVVRGEFTEVEAPRKIAYRWNGEERIEVEITPHGSGSRMTLTHSNIPDGMDPSILTNGWTSGMEQLAALTL
jgi:uncharacterized protein YndB with AHSA1/START domain